jgi:hypothetical protein
LAWTPHAYCVCLHKAPPPFRSHSKNHVTSQHALSLI